MYRLQLLVASSSFKSHPWVPCTKQKMFNTKRLFGPKILRVVKLNIHLFLEPRSLPESDGQRDRGGIGGSKNKYFNQKIIFKQ